MLAIFVGSFLCLCTHIAECVWNGGDIYIYMPLGVCVFFFLGGGYFFEDVLLMEFIQPNFYSLACQVSYRRRLKSFLLCLCDVFRALINSLVYWFCHFWNCAQAQPTDWCRHGEWNFDDDVGLNALWRRADTVVLGTIWNFHKLLWYICPQNRQTSNCMVWIDEGGQTSDQDFRARSGSSLCISTMLDPFSRHSGQEDNNVQSPLHRNSASWQTSPRLSRSSDKVWEPEFTVALRPQRP